MFRTFLIITATTTLVLGGNLARADHDGEWRYVLGGALIGAAIGSIAADHHDHGYVVHGHRHLRVHDYYRHAPRRHVHRGPIYIERHRPVYRANWRIDGRDRGRGRRHHRRHGH